MDNLVLFQVAADLDAGLTGAVLREVREEDVHRFRFLFDHPEGNRSVLVSVRPEAPWIGRPAGRWPGRKRGPTRFAALLARVLGSAVVRQVAKGGPDRICRIVFSHGYVLVLELTVHRGNIVLVRPDGTVEAGLRHRPKSDRRLEPGSAYTLPRLPSKLLFPERCDAGEIDQQVAVQVDLGHSLPEALRRTVFGLGRTVAAAIAEESNANGVSIGTRCRERLDQVLSLEATTWYGGPGLSPVLLPWTPEGELPDRPDSGAAAVAGRYYEDLERSARFLLRVDGMTTLLRREIRRAGELSDKIHRDMERFADPESYRRHGEAILAGIGQARRASGQVLVPDPYDQDGRLLSIPDKAGEPLHKVADGCFAMHRRAVRGLAAAQDRDEKISARLRNLNRFLDELEALEGEEPVAGLSRLHDLEDRMQQAGFAIGLAPMSRKQQGMPQPGKPRLEGVRVFPREDRYDILVGRDGRSNARLTFKLAAAEDFWLHALNATGAHVIIRNPERKSRPPEDALRVAASAAAWFSDARNHAQVDVQWTRRKYVRKARKGAPGMVILKRFETIRVRPAVPQAPESAT